MDRDKLEIKEIKPALAGYIRKALALLRKNPVPDDDAVHDIRVLMKKARAVLKLIRLLQISGWPEKDYDSLRKVGRILAGRRDVSVYRKILKELRKKSPGLFISLDENEKIRCILQPEPVHDAYDDSIQIIISEMDELLSKTGFRIRFSRMNDIGFDALYSQLDISYDIVKKAFLNCRERPKPENIHEFRKRSKDFLYQLWFFRPVNSNVVRGVAKRLDRMAVNLGKYNDLNQLLSYLDYSYPNDLNDPSMDELALKIREKQDDYLASVWKDAYKCFAPRLDLKKLLNIID